MRSAAPTSAKAAAAVVESYYALLSAGRCEDAYRLWGQDGAAAAGTLDEFRRRAQRLRGYTAKVGAPGRIEGAAGSLYVSVPVSLATAEPDGEQVRQAGTATLRRVNDVPGSTPEQRRWRIVKMELAPARPDATGAHAAGRRP